MTRYTDSSANREILEKAWIRLLGSIRGALELQVLEVGTEEAASRKRDLEKKAGQELRTLLAKRLGRSEEDLAFSTSHSWHKNSGVILVAAAERAQRGSSFAIGVDLEKADRKLGAETTARVIDAKEKALKELSPLDFWMIKEAAFKADPENEGSVLSNYTAVSFEPATGCGQVRRAGKDLLISFVLVKFGEWAVVLAVSRSS